MPFANLGRPSLFNMGLVENRIMEEIWKPVVGYEGRYEVSSLGRIKSLARQDIRGNNRVERIRKPVKPNGRYITVYLSADSKIHRRTLHSIIAEAFIGPRPEGMSIDHIDGDKINNNPTNLEYVTPRENSRRYYRGKNPSGVVGVSYSETKKKWSAVYRHKHIGYFENKILAIEKILEIEAAYEL